MLMALRNLEDATSVAIRAICQRWPRQTNCSAQAGLAKPKTQQYLFLKKDQMKQRRNQIMIFCMALLLSSCGDTDPKPTPTPIPTATPVPTQTATPGPTVVQTPDDSPPAITPTATPNELSKTVKVYDDLKVELIKCSPEGASSIVCQFAVTNMGTSNDKISALIGQNRSDTYISDSNSNSAAFGGILGSNLGYNSFEVISEKTYNLRLKFDGFDRKEMEISLLSLSLYNIYKISGPQRRGVDNTVLTWKKIPVSRP